jgi:hypothetical protein
MRLSWATVVSAERVGEGLQRLDVELDDGARGRAIGYPTLSSWCQEGDRVLLNTTAVDLALGTGGSHFVVARLGEAAGVAVDAPSGGHIMKLRYTPMQLDVVSVESPESPHHETMRSATSLDGMPVVCCGLHSQVPLVAAAVKKADPALRVAYCMTDQAALSLHLSDLMRASVGAGLVDTTLTCGQSFGGELETVNLHSGLLAARHVAEADVAIAAIGPGVVGTGTPFGHGGVGQGEAINAAGVLGGRPVACLRVSFADVRSRHRGVSHHSLVALSRIACTPATVAIPALADEFLDAIDEQLVSAGVWNLHRRADAECTALDSPSLKGVEVRSMGRGPVDDPAFFAAAFAAGEIASKVAAGVL